MGAYDNPQIIRPPDYGEIFRRNFEQGKAQVEAAQERAQARRDKIKAENQRIDDRILQFDLARQEIKAGDLTQSLQQQTNFLADDFAENERLYSENQISREEYNKNRTSAFRKLQEMKGLAGILVQQSKEYQDINKSEYQGEAINGAGLIEAWAAGEIKFQYVGDELEMYYQVDAGDGKKELIQVDTQSLKEGEFFNINEKYALTDNQLKSIGGGVVLKPEFRKGSKFKTADGTEIERIEDQYARGISNEEFKENQITSYMGSSTLNEIMANRQDKGSIWADTVSKGMVITVDGKRQLSDEGKSLIKRTFKKKTPEEIALIEQQVLEDKYNAETEGNLDIISRRFVAEAAWEQVKGNVQGAETVSSKENVDENLLQGYKDQISTMFERERKRAISGGFGGGFDYKAMAKNISTMLGRNFEVKQDPMNKEDKKYYIYNLSLGSSGADFYKVAINLNKKNDILESLVNATITSPQERLNALDDLNIN